MAARDDRQGTTCSTASSPATGAIRTPSAATPPASPRCTTSISTSGKAAPDGRAVLVLTGWVDWADGSTFLGAAQGSGAAW